MAKPSAGSALCFRDPVYQYHSYFLSDRNGDTRPAGLWLFRVRWFSAHAHRVAGLLMVIGIVGYFSVPNLANYVVHAGGGNTILQRVNTIVRCKSYRPSWQNPVTAALRGGTKHRYRPPGASQVYCMRFQHTASCRLAWIEQSGPGWRNGKRIILSRSEIGISQQFRTGGISAG